MRSSVRGRLEKPLLRENDRLRSGIRICINYVHELRTSITVPATRTESQATVRDAMARAWNRHYVSRPCF